MTTALKNLTLDCSFLVSLPKVTLFKSSLGIICWLPAVAAEVLYLRVSHLKLA